MEGVPVSMGLLRQHNEQMIKIKAVFPKLDKVLTDPEGEVVHSELRNH